jgi:hypothetical protein
MIGRYNAWPVLFVCLPFRCLFLSTSEFVFEEIFKVGRREFTIGDLLQQMVCFALMCDVASILFGSY